MGKQRVFKLTSLRGNKVLFSIGEILGNTRVRDSKFGMLIILIFKNIKNLSYIDNTYICTTNSLFAKPNLGILNS